MAAHAKRAPVGRQGKAGRSRPSGPKKSPSVTKAVKTPVAASLGTAPPKQKRPASSAAAKSASGGPVLPPDMARRIAKARKRLGLTQRLFARMIGATDRAVASWERGAAVSPMASKQIAELERLAGELEGSMKPEFIPTWLNAPLQVLGGSSPIEAWGRGEADRVWRLAFFMGSGLPT
ncbi:helix-turn-helix protein [Aquisphaera giovannonii]|uniref:Helix-turn-helix protein n=1 Tax=Aquisphaera giovannonii TaxID=406548 RepID=A0A5B9VVJ9_9BACT|nr:helix-turn-helix domain-containing protein [Aquisphaera giovannonii]QEH32258.1 helix-turn-helix protein [Aquisphaera giovannonii]